MSDQPQYGLTYEEWYEVAKYLNPDLPQQEYDRLWREFVVAKEEAEALKQQGVKIHPHFGSKP